MFIDIDVYLGPGRLTKSAWRVLSFIIPDCREIDGSCKRLIVLQLAVLELLKFSIMPLKSVSRGHEPPILP